MHVLIVEDEKKMAELLKKGLEEENHSVSLAFDGRDALEMAEAIQQKRFPCFVATPSSDNYYRVQVGPYQDVASAESAKRALEQLGFKPIIKR